MTELSKYIVEGRLTEREIKTLRKDLSIYNQKRFESAIGNGRSGGINHSIRNSQVFFPKPQDFPKTFNILQSTIIGAYQTIAPYIDFTNFAEIQYARYDKGCFFKKHRDTIYKDGHDKRILTFSINVSEEDSYENGELVVFDDQGKEVITQLSKKIGSFIIFPAVFFHEAKEVTSGTRKAIVTWIHADDKVFDRFKSKIYN